MTTQNRKIILSVTLLLVVVSFQNCAEVGQFAADSYTDSFSEFSSEATTTTIVPGATTTTKAPGSGASTTTTTKPPTVTTQPPVVTTTTQTPPASGSWITSCQDSSNYTAVHIRSLATGTGNGCDWANAMTALPATLKRGVTYFIAAGTYAGYTFDDTVSGITPITIRKATPQVHGTDSGWSESYGTGQATWNSELTFLTSYWVFDGQTRSENNWMSGAEYGFRIYHNSKDNQITIGANEKYPSNIEIKYVFLEALATALPSNTISRYSIRVNQYQNSSLAKNILIHRSYFKNGNVPIWLQATDGVTVEYSAFDSNTGNAANHSEAVSAYYTSDHFIARYNQFRRIMGTAIIATCSSGGSDFIEGSEFYGNVVWESNISDGIFGFLAGKGLSRGRNIKVYNNTIVDKTSGYSQAVSIAEAGTDNQVYNNLWINTEGSWWPGNYATYNSNGYSWSYSELNAQVNVSSAIFVNYSGRDFRLASPTQKGISLPAPYNQDMFGNIRGTDGVWDRGAFEFKQ